MTKAIKAIPTIEPLTKQQNVKREPLHSPKSPKQDAPASNPTQSSHKGRLIDVMV